MGFLGSSLCCERGAWGTPGLPTNVAKAAGAQRSPSWSWGVLGSARTTWGAAPERAEGLTDGVGEWGPGQGHGTQEELPWGSGWGWHHGTGLGSGACSSNRSSGMPARAGEELTFPSCHHGVPHPLQVGAPPAPAPVWGLVAAGRGAGPGLPAPFCSVRRIRPSPAPQFVQLNPTGRGAGSAPRSAPRGGSGASNPTRREGTGGYEICEWGVSAAGAEQPRRGHCGAAEPRAAGLPTQHRPTAQPGRTAGRRCRRGLGRRQPVMSYDLFHLLPA